MAKLTTSQGDASSAETAGAVFAVYSLETGSFTAGEFRMEPLTVKAIPASLAERIDPDSAPVKLFKSEAAAAEYVDKLRAEFDRKRNPKKA